MEQQLFHDGLSLDATYFYNRYYDLIVILGGSLAALSHYESDNLANARAQGGEFSAGFRPARWLFWQGAPVSLASSGQLLAVFAEADSGAAVRAGPDRVARGQRAGV